MSELLDSQHAFVTNVAKLIQHGVLRGDLFTFGEVWSDDRNSVHVKRSLHNIRLAIDLNLFINGEWITREHEEWEHLGAFWKGLDARCRWGGDIAGKLDLNHFSMTPTHDDPRI